MAAFFNLLGENEQQLKPAICFNTDSAFDILTGEIKQGIDGKYYINGGMSPAVIGVMGVSFINELINFWKEQLKKS